MAGATPQLSGDALRAVRHRGTHVQIIAAAGSGKTEVVSQRVADLLADGVEPRGVVAFTFTERAAAELKARIGLRVEERLGREALDKLGGVFVGTIHAYCFRLLQQHVPRYETFDVLDDNQLTAFLSREATRLNIKQLDPNGRLFASIGLFLKSVDVVENELLDPEALPNPFRTVVHDYLDTLERYRLLTYGQQISRAVAELERPDVQAAVTGELRHLIVDEYQDVNPAQERLIELLASPGVELCVVGDDDQAIYQWRGSDVGNIVSFTDRYPSVAVFRIDTNRRSRPGIVATANGFAATISGRLEKKMLPHRLGGGGPPEVVLWHDNDEEGEAGWIAKMIVDLHEDEGVAYSDIAVLARSRAAYRRLVDAFGSFDVPVQPGGRTGLFDQPEAQVLGHTMVWLTGFDWRDTYGPPRKISDTGLLDEYQQVFALSAAQRRKLGRVLDAWRKVVPKQDRRANLVGELYELLDELGAKHWDLTDPIQLNRLGTLARFTALLADYESVRRRARPDAQVAGEQVGGQDRGEWYYKNLAIHIVNYAQGAYEAFDGEEGFALDAVDLTTVHGAKGLEWPVVFVPSVTAKRFPSARTGQTQPWLVSRTMFDADRYEGSDADERRLFYVAMTRARDWLSVSRHDKVTKQRVGASPYYGELRHLELDPSGVQYPEVEAGGDPDETVTVTYSEMAAFLECGAAYRLRNLIGFQPRLAPELGYGKAVHHVLRAVAEATRATGEVPKAAQIDQILDHAFFLPTANKVTHRELKIAARKLVTTYAANHADDLHRIWETERPFELRLDGVTITGRADVILDHENGVPTALAILDYKTATASHIDYGLQLQVYADAGRREGLDVRGAYVHDLKLASRTAIDVSEAALATAEATVRAAAVRLRDRDFHPSPGKPCRRCEVRTVCASAYH